MLFFLSIAATEKFVIDDYVDNAVDVMEKDKELKLSMTRVTLRPKVTFSVDNKSTRAQIEEMHHQLHQQCFIANSVNTTVVTEIIG